MKTRFAPSPTGMLHIGGVRTALFAWLAAKHDGGTFVLRIEDTDRERLVEGSEQQIIDSLKWLGIESDEPVVRQSERLGLYREYAQKLIDKGLAYADPFSKEELDAFREQAKAEKRAFLYRHHRPENPPVWDGSQPLRLKTPEIKRMEWHDVVRGNLSAGEDALDDFILLKAADENGDCYPTYNFCHIVDDHEMGITHVLRGEEFIASTPKFLSLYDALEIDRPVLATMPPILGKEGGKKLSKRDGSKSTLDYRDEGFLSEAVVNFLVNMGWNDGTDKEIYSTDELIEAFSLERIQKSPARFDEAKLSWINWQHIVRMIENDEQRLMKLLDDRGASYKSENFSDVTKLAATKSRNFEDFLDQISIFWSDISVAVEAIDLTKIDAELTIDFAQKIIEYAKEKLQSVEFKAEEIESELRAMIDELEVQPRTVLMLLRDKITGKKVSPSLFETMELLGREEVLRRLAV
jgi:glutamyl-tRNA synthetase